MKRTLALTCLTLCLTLSLTLLGGVRAQADPVAALDELLRGGYYALAAQVDALHQRYLGFEAAAR